MHTFTRFDAGSTARNWDTGDCTVRALCTATAMTYREAWNLLYTMQGEHKTCSFRLVEFLRREPRRLHAREYMPFKAVRGQNRMTGQEFCKRYPKGRYLLRLAHHVVAVVDGRLYDTWDSSAKCVYGAWRML